MPSPLAILRSLFKTDPAGWANRAAGTVNRPGAAKFLYDAQKIAPTVRSGDQMDRLLRAAEQGYNTLGYRYTKSIPKDETHLRLMADPEALLNGEQFGYHVDLTPGGPASKSRAFNVTHDFDVFEPGYADIHPLALRLENPTYATDELANQLPFLRELKRRGVSNSVVYSPTEGELAGGDEMRQFIERLRNPGLWQPSAAVLDPTAVRLLKSAEFSEPARAGLNYADGGAVPEDSAMHRGSTVFKSLGGLVQKYKAGGRVKKPIWDKARPKSLGASQPLSSAAKSAAKAAAKSAGRPYPNLVDNMRAAGKI